MERRIHRYERMHPRLLHLRRELQRAAGTPVPAEGAPSEAHIGKVFGIVSGKGGVGKSMVTSQLAVTMRRRGHQSAFWMPTSPVPPSQAFGIHGQATGSEAGLYPMVSKTGIQVMSTNLLLPNETDPVIWRGPVISGVVQQFWTDVLWNCDYLFVDMPPGTGDVSLSVFQSIPLDGIVIRGLSPRSW